MARKKKKSKKIFPKLKKIKLPPPRRLIKWGFVGFLWIAIFFGLLTAWYATDLPALIDSPQFERKSAMTLYDNEENVIVRYGDLKGISVTVADLPPHLIYAVLAVEDRRFYQHHGVDPIGIARAFAANMVRGHIAQGGSTITQQLAKNLFLSHERTLKRKIQEALLALWLERELTKDEILSAYLNRVYLGAGAYGVDAAARTYFDKPATEVTLHEAAMLAGLLKAPSRYSPQNNPGLAAQRAKTVLAAMKDAGYISDSQAGSFKSVAPMPERKPDEGDAERYFADWIAGELDKLIGATDLDLKIETTLDPVIQKAAQTVLNRVLRENEERNVTQGALVVMDSDGAVLAMVGGRNYTASQFNRAVQSRRPPGSAFKPFVYLAALEEGWKSDDMIADTPITEGSYRPENFHKEYSGEVTLEEALARSLNTSAVRLAQHVGIRRIIETAHRAGIKSDLPRDLSLALGSQGVPLIEMCTAYATLAAHGAQVHPYAIRNIRSNEDDDTLYHHVSLTGRQVFKRQDVDSLNRMLMTTIEEGTGRRARLPFDAAGKTGTSQDFRDALFIGHADGFTAAVWVGNDDNSPMSGVTGGSLPAAIWHDVMMAAHSRKRNTDDRFSAQDTERGFQNIIERLLFFND